VLPNPFLADVFMTGAMAFYLMFRQFPFAQDFSAKDPIYQLLHQQKYE
jgi:hypothetical protein